MQVNGLHHQQQHMGMPGVGAQQWPMGQIPAHTGLAHPSAAAGSGMGGPGGFGGMAPGLGSLGGGSGMGGSGSGMIHKGGSLQGVGGSGAANSNSGSGAWSGHDDVSNLMRQVAHGGKYDPAFDFVADEFKASKR